MEFQRDLGQRKSLNLPTGTDISSDAGGLRAVVYYIRRGMGSVLSIFIASIDGIKNGLLYKQGHLIATTKNDARFNILDNGNLTITCPINEEYEIDSEGHLIATVTE